MDVDDSVIPSQEVNITACLVLNQRDDERLGFDFVSFPGNNEVIGVVDLTPGAHFIYVKKNDGNDEIDLRLGEFVHVASGSCTVLKRSKLDDGALFDVADTDEARSYQSSVIAGHFSGKLAKVPPQLRELWRNLTDFITDDVIRALRPLERKVASKSKFRIQDSKPDTCNSQTAKVNDEQANAISHVYNGNSLRIIDAPGEDPASPHASDTPRHAKEVNYADGNSESLSMAKKSFTSCSDIDGVAGLEKEQELTKQDCTKEFLSLSTQEDDTVEDYIEISKRFKGIKGNSGLLCELFTDSKKSSQATSTSQKFNLNGIDSDNNTNSDASIHTKSAQNTMDSNDMDKEAIIDSDLADDHCTVYYSDLRRINRKMTLLTNMSPDKITEMHLDTTYIMDAIASNHRRFKASSERSVVKPSGMSGCDQHGTMAAGLSSYEAVVGEYQYAFCLFLLNFHYDSFEHWKAIFRAICSAETFFLANVALASRLLNVMKLQLETFESDLYEPDNFFAYHLNTLEEIITDNQPQLASLKQPFEDIRNTFKLKFGISLEDAKVLQDSVQIVYADEIQSPNINK